MPIQPGVVTGPTLSDDRDSDLTGLYQSFEGLIDGGQRNGRIALFNGLIDQLGGRVVALVLLDGAKDFKALRGNF